MQRLTLPGSMYHEKGALKALKTLEDKKAIVCVGGGSIHRGGFFNRAIAYLKKAGMEVRLSEGIESDPSVETVTHEADEMLTFESDWIVAMNGGSPIGTARAMWTKYEYPEITFENMYRVFGMPKLRRKAQFCAIPSTPGTMAEVTAFSAVTDCQKSVKYPITDFETIPDVATVGPDLVTTMLTKLVAHTDMDAMTHAVEAYVSTTNSSSTDPLAVHAVEMVKEHLVKSCNRNMDSRTAIYGTQCLAGQILSNVLLGIAHSMTHRTKAVSTDQGTYIIHGAANAMYLSEVIKFNTRDKMARGHYSVTVDYMHLGGFNDKEKMSLLITYLREMSSTLHAPHCIVYYEKDELPAEEGFVSRDVLLARIKGIAANIILDACTGGDPRQPSQEEMIKLLKYCYYDAEVDFQYRN